jgi:cytochrome P450
VEKDQVIFFIDILFKKWLFKPLFLFFHRTKISPFFTPSKLKRMNPLIFSSCNHLVQELDRLVVEKSGRVDLMPTLGLCVVDGIAQCIFGMEVKDLRDPHLLKFKEYSENVTKM